MTATLDSDRSDTAEPVEPPPSPSPAPARWRGRLRRHWLFAALLLLGVLLRVATVLAYPPAVQYVGSYRYLGNLVDLDLDVGRFGPIGYDLVLRAVLPFGGLRTVVITQHVVGVGLAFAVYGLALRHGARRWLAALAAAPVLLDAYQVRIEQNITSELWLEALLVVVLWLLLGRAAPRPLRAGVAGVLLGCAVLVSTVALPLAVPVLIYLAAAGGAWRSRAGWRVIGARAGALFGCFAVVVFGYAGYVHLNAGSWALPPSASGALYGRTAEVADCTTLKLDPVLEQLCPAEPLGARKGVDWYAHLDGDPNWPAVVPVGQTTQQLEHQFSLAVLRHQPAAVLTSVFKDVGKRFAPTRKAPVTASAPQPTGWLDAYQLHGGSTPGPLLAGCGVLGLLGALGTRRRSGLRAPALLVTASAATLLFASAAFEFSGQLPGVVLLPLAGALGLTVLIGPLRRPKPVREPRRMLGAFPDRVDGPALNEFTSRYGQPRFAPVLVVIAAYNEEGGIGGVLDNLPSSCLGLDVDVLVVVDGCTDGTAAEALAHGAYVCVAPVNRGQGAALRLGYHLAGYGGARYVVTTDADGQYDNDEMPLLLGPLVADTADFVTGSRRLGREETDDRVRSAGVRFFAGLASVLTWRRITDTSFGFRAMRTELARSVRLRQPQYQASELLLGALAGGARLLEQPMTMRIRSAGSTKKGNNLVYGRNYAAVMTWTWLREFVLRRPLRQRVTPSSAGRARDSAART